MVYNSVKYVQIGKKNGNEMVFISAHLIVMDPQPHVLLWHCLYLVIIQRSVKGSAEWFSISPTATGHIQKLQINQEL